tara:strand:+ start:346 stop:969 length:624 start_codon:yes stop_codon:yes gene_type:complete
MAELTTVMEALETANKERGVSLGRGRGGKLYTMVQDRVLEWRRVFGCQHGISTAILSDDGNAVVVKATITDEQSRVIGSGMAEEIRGASGVNKTSALENCETSAIGRALASLGLHGGEYASVQEIGKKDRYAEKEAAEKVEPAPTPDWAGWVADHIAGMQKHRNMAEHKRWSSTVRTDREKLAREDPALHTKLLDAYNNRKATLENY